MLAQVERYAPETASITGRSLKSVHTILKKYMLQTKVSAKSAMTKIAAQILQPPAWRDGVRV